MTRVHARPMKRFAIPLAGAIVAVVGAGAAWASPGTPVSAPTPSIARTATTANVDFRGVWASATGGWRIVTENLATGACTGTSDFVGYTLTGCEVTGHSYVFVVNLEPSYHSYNSGTISGNAVQGEFHDTNTNHETYSATRTRSASTTKITAKPTTASKGAAVSYSVRVSSSFGPPRGKAQVKVGKKVLCAITLSAAGAGSCKTTKTPVGRHELVSASYAGSSVPPFTASAASIRITITR